MNCKDCIHYELCELHWLTSENACKRFFKDKSKFIELPCKIGDEIYIIRMFDNKIVRDIIKDFEIWSISDGFKLRIEALHNKDYVIGEFGKDIFLTREDAENELSRRA